MDRDPDDPAVVPPVTPVTLADFPRNVDEVRLDAISLLVVRAGERAAEGDELAVEHLHLVRGDRRVEGGSAEARDDVISTRLGTGATWASLVDPPDMVAPVGGGEPTRWDKQPTGTWELALSSEANTREALRSGAVEDLVLVLSYRSELLAWPT